jgi:hypothetical protein
VLIARSEVTRVSDPDMIDGTVGVEPWFLSARSAGRSDTEALASGAIDMARFSELVQALLLLRPDGRMDHQWLAGHEPAFAPLPAWRILAPFFSRHKVRVAGQETRLRPAATWARELVTGGLEHVLAAALLRWTLAGLPPVYSRRSVPVLANRVDGVPLAAALLCSAGPADIDEAVRAVVDHELQPTSQGEPS